MKKTIFLITLFFGLVSSAQHKKIIYGFDKIPQGLLLNPGSETTYKYHIGVPILSGLSGHLNISGITIADVFRDDAVGIFDGTNFTKRLSNAVAKLDDNDYGYFNSQIEILNLGYKINHRDYLSGGFYIETDIFSTLPKDLGVLVTDGNVNHIGKEFDISQTALQAEMLGVFHIGLSRRITSRLTVGGRLKLYSGSTSVTSIRNFGTFTTTLGTDSKYINTIDGLDASLKSSGVFDENNENVYSTKKALGNSFFRGNFGLGFDLGFTFHINEQWEVTGSILDFGYIKYSKNIRNKTVKGNYKFTGVEYDFNKPNTDYWNELEKKFDKEVVREENKESYSVTRPLKGYLNYAYSFGKSKNRATCHDNTYKDFFDNTVGLQVFAVVQPKGINWAYTGFYQRKLSKHLNLKATYTIDDFSYSNIGLGASLNIWKVNIYGSVGNVFGVTDVVDSHSFSTQIGINFIMN